LTLLLSDKLGLETTGVTSKVQNEDAEKLRAEIRKSLSEKKTDIANEGPVNPPTPPEKKA
jgi:hypothetical protein